LDAASRDIQLIRLPRWGRVAVGAGAVPWLVFDEEGRAVEPIRRFLIDFVARDNRPGSVRSYAFDLLRCRGHDFARRGPARDRGIGTVTAGAALEQSQAHERTGQLI